MTTPDRAEIERWQDYTKHPERLSNGLEFDSVEAMQTTTFISGSRGTGKSDLAMLIADQLKNEDVIICVFDSSTDWLKRSSISQYLTVNPYSSLPIPEYCTIFDLSRLTPLQQQETVENFSKKLFYAQLNSDKQYLLVCEESQVYFPLGAMRSKKCQNSMRLLTVGRNLGISACAISQFPALIDKELIKNAQQIYIGCTAEPNTLRYWRGILGNKTAKLKKLSNGEFLYYNRSKIEKIAIEPYECTTVKKEIANCNALTPQPLQITSQKTDCGALIKFAVICLIGLIIMGLR